MAFEHECSPYHQPRERILIIGAAGRDFHVRGKRVLVIEDRPTLTHGEMGYGSGTIAAQRHGTTEIVDPSPFTRGSLVEIFARYLWEGRALAAMGYSQSQLEDLARTIKATPCDGIVVQLPWTWPGLLPFLSLTAGCVMISKKSVTRISRKSCRVFSAITDDGT
jgi:predicted GTPase